MLPHNFPGVFDLLGRRRHRQWVDRQVFGREDGLAIKAVRGCEWLGGWLCAVGGPIRQTVLVLVVDEDEVAMPAIVRLHLIPNSRGVALLQSNLPDLKRGDFDQVLRVAACRGVGKGNSVWVDSRWKVRKQLEKLDQPSTACRLFHTKRPSSPKVALLSIVRRLMPSGPRSLRSIVGGGDKVAQS